MVTALMGCTYSSRFHEKIIHDHVRKPRAPGDMLSTQSSYMVVPRLLPGACTRPVSTSIHCDLFDNS